VNPAIYAFIEQVSPWLVLWIAGFTLVTFVRVMGRLLRGVARVADSVFFTELPGLPIAALQSICFFWAVASGDWLSALLFLWWGPGFLVIASLYIAAKRSGRSIDWHPYRYIISWLCKGCYVLYAAVFAWRGMFVAVFVLSAWIINDQIEKALMSLDADRLRRTFDDGWLFRTLYPAGLLIPCFTPGIPFRGALAGYGLLLLAAWICSVGYVWRKGLLRARPDDPSLLRNMVYFSRLRQ